MAAIEDLATGLSEALGYTVYPSTEDSIVVLIDGRQTLEILNRPSDGVVEITTPITSAHDGLPLPVMTWLMTKNLPNDETAGAHLSRRPSSDHLQLINVIPNTALNPGETTLLAWRQAVAAMEIADDVDRRGDAWLAAR